MKPLLLFILSLLAIYTYKEKFWAAYERLKSTQVWNAILISIIVGFMMVLLVQELEAFSGGVYRFDGL
jgi:uncharacterized membrane protein (UPF0182 family)